MMPVLPDKLFFKIGEVSKVAGVEQHVLRYWEEEFEVLKPDKNRSGQRMYQKKDIEQILDIKRLLYVEGYTITGARKRLKQKKKTIQQMDLGFDREALQSWKKDFRKDLKSILKVLDKR